MSLELLEYREEMATDWDTFCARAVNATLLHTRRFLSYHGERFTDASLVLVEDGRWVGLLPAARVPGNPSIIVSHPGATFGGLVHDGRLLGHRTIDALSAATSYFAARGVTTLLYKPLPSIYPLLPAQDDLYALFRLHARRVRCDLSSTIDLSARRPPSERRRRALKKAHKSVAVEVGGPRLPDLWAIVEDNLDRKYGARAVHSPAEMAELARRFPDAIRSLVALVDGRVEAGVILFLSSRVWHAQYIASSERGYELSALDAVFDRALQDATAMGARYFDFGTSNEDEGRVLNDGLYRFKSEFGGGGAAYETYELDLAAGAPSDGHACS
jgi:CelD/BcsL family acetyltransferase involved in cellulose biosynthesis